MKGYIYITGTATDPGVYRNLNDPILTASPSLGACMTNIRRLVLPGDFVFVISGTTKGVQQYVVGGFQVQEKIDAMTAYKRYPENRLRQDDQGQLLGNIIVDENGKQHPLDRHDPKTFNRRIEDYLVGTNPVALETSAQIERGRSETLDTLATILEKPRTNRVIDLMGRWAKLDESQINQTLDWLRGIANTTP